YWKNAGPCSLLLKTRNKQVWRRAAEVAITQILGRIPSHVPDLQTMPSGESAAIFAPQTAGDGHRSGCLLTACISAIEKLGRAWRSVECQGEVVHHRVLLGRDEPLGDLGPQARCPSRGAGRVFADLDGDSWHLYRRTSSPPGSTDGQAGDHTLDQSRRFSTWPRNVLEPDRTPTSSRGKHSAAAQRLAVAPCCGFQVEDSASRGARGGAGSVP